MLDKNLFSSPQIKEQNLRAKTIEYQPIKVITKDSEGKETIIDLYNHTEQAENYRKRYES